MCDGRLYIRYVCDFLIEAQGMAMATSQRGAQGNGPPNWLTNILSRNGTILL